jgi:hypothetical protein
MVEVWGRQAEDWQVKLDFLYKALVGQCVIRWECEVAWPKAAREKGKPAQLRLEK